MKKATFNRNDMARVSRIALERVLLVAVVSMPMFAFAAGQGGLINDRLIGVLKPVLGGLVGLSLCVGVGGALFKPELVKGAAYTLVISLVLFWLVNNLRSVSMAVQG